MFNQQEIQVIAEQQEGKLYVGDQDLAIAALLDIARQTPGMTEDEAVSTAQALIAGIKAIRAEVN